LEADPSRRAGEPTGRGAGQSAVTNLDMEVSALQSARYFICAASRLLI
jgi:hypothetical protein